MWSTLTFLLVVLASALGAGIPSPFRGPEAAPMREAVPERAPAVTPAVTPASEAAALPEARSASFHAPADLYHAPELSTRLADCVRELAEQPLRPRDYQRTDVFELPDVSGNPQLFRRVWGRTLTPGGRISVELGAQVRVFDDRDFAPPELVAGVRVRF